MKVLSKPLIIGGVLTAVGLSTLAGISVVSAESGSSANDPVSSLVKKIASRFNLNEGDVQKVFDEDKQARETQREQKQAEKLQALVDNGTITTAQKTAIEAKLKELKTERETNKDDMKNITQAERKAKMEAKRTELEAWAKEQGLDLTKLKGIFMGEGHEHGGHGPMNN